MRTILSFFLYWLPSALIITLFAGLIYVAVQQDMRQSANDPQIQVAEDMASLLSSGISPKNLISPGSQLDISKTLSTFATIYDDSGKVVVSSALLNGQPLSLPQGVFDYTRTHQEDRFTWQPEKELRMAAVTVRYQSPTASGFVVVARSLREVEKRESSLFWEVFAVWVLSLLISLVTQLILFTKKYVVNKI